MVKYSDLRFGNINVANNACVNVVFHCYAFGKAKECYLLNYFLLWSRTVNSEPIPKLLFTDTRPP